MQELLEVAMRNQEFYSKIVIVCFSSGILYEQLADALAEQGYWEFVWISEN